MTFSLIILTVLLVITFGCFQFLFWTSKTNKERIVSTYSRLIAKQESKYRALDQGMEELTEAYEMQLLSKEDYIKILVNADESKGKDIAVLLKVLLNHDEHCLPDLSFTLSEEDQSRLESLRLDKNYTPSNAGYIPQH